MLSPIKRYIAAATSAFILFTFAPAPIKAAGPNLIPNPSVETVGVPKTVPANWATSAWGSNTPTFTYQTPTARSTSAYDGKRSVAVSVKNYVDGDAKWYVPAVAVTPDTDYVYSDYSIQNTTTYLVAALYDATGNASYVELGSAPLSKVWKKTTVGVSTKHDTVSMSIFHILRSNGTLQSDFFNLHVADTATITNNVPNYSVEQSNGISNQPLAWAGAGWGSNTRTFAYVTSGKTGTKSIRVNISNYVDGDAKWMYTPQPVTPNQYYRFRDYYMSDGPSYVYAAVTLTDQSTQYMYLGDGTTSTSWKLFSRGFTTPANAQSVTIFHVIARNGFLTTDDYSLKPMAGPQFDTGHVSITFDDGWASISTTALPLLDAKQFKSTQYLVSGFINTPNYMTTQQVQDLVAAGHEVGSHTVTHTDLTTLNLTDLRAELANSKTFLEGLTQKPVHAFALPYGAYNPFVLTETKAQYASTRSSDIGYNTLDNFNPDLIRIQAVEATTTPAELAGWVTAAKTNHTWLVLLYHNVDGTGSQYGVSAADLSAELDSISASGLPVETVSQAIAALTPQL